MGSVHKLHVLSFLTTCSTSRNFSTKAIRNVCLGFVQKRNRVCKSRSSDFMLEQTGLHSVTKDNIISPFDSDLMRGTSLVLVPCRSYMA
jgi:hypothetical protein